MTTVYESEAKFNYLLGKEFKKLGEYVRNKDKILILCLKHNVKFLASPRMCKSKGYIFGCKQCEYERKSLAVRNYDCIKQQKRQCNLRLKKLLGVNYKLLSQYKGRHTKIKAKCLIHNQRFYLTLGNCFKFNRILGCPGCSRLGNNTRKFDFGKIVSYSKKFKVIDNYTGLDNGIKAYCKKHKKFFHISPRYTIRKEMVVGCSKCQQVSTPERQILRYIENLIGKENVVHQPSNIRDKDGIIKPDILIPGHNIIIEHNGIYWHSKIVGSDKDDQWFHYKRQQRLKALGYRVVYIWSDDWVKRTEAIKRYINALLCPQSLHVWDARKLTIKSITNEFANKFFNKYHPQGQTAGKHIYIGLYDKTIKRTVAIIGFSTTSRPVLNKSDTAELTRYASRGRVRGGASRLLAHYTEHNSNINTIISFSDNDYFDGGMYTAIGFVSSGETKPDYTTIWGQERRHKSYTQRANLVRLAKQGKIIFNASTMTEKSCLEYNNIRRCWNSGKKRWIYTKELGIRS